MTTAALSLSPTNASLGLGRPSSGKARRSHPRESSGAYQLFDAKQVQVFREAFSLIDQDNDGIISEADLRGLLASLGQQPSHELLHSLLHAQPLSSSSSQPSSPASPLPINFTTFVTLLASHLSPLSPEQEMLEAFACFDERNEGFVRGGEVREWLGGTGNRMTEAEIDRLLHAPFYDPKTDLFNYRLWCSTLRVTDVDEAEGDAKGF
ncbi:myosin regulatory light chain 9 [Rhodotorula toruloides]|uniref:Myosin regulatory light chain 9 n=1 Tax=Rhodotorula toruloides TaxID=5286 RepID=A0A511KTA4_RHOTO|nr:myosin regulatory light chain 9 [Rhodotorula toruloides]